nr:hypothetical protein [Microbacterium hydrocarbonoxydans]
MSDAQDTSHRGDSEETPMIPHELTPRQQSEDPIPNDPDAAGNAANSPDESTGAADDIDETA